MKKPKENNGNVTLKEVAAVLGVSTMTVSRAINDKPNVDALTKKKILDTAKKMGYTPNLVAKSLVSSKTYTIGVVIPEISHSFFPEVVKGIQEEANKKNYQIFLTNTSDDFETEKKVIDALRAKRVDGILVSSSQTKEDVGYYQKIIASGLPLVFFDRCFENIGASCIGVNDFSASQQITEHLINRGYKRIGYLSGPRKVSIGKERFGGYVAAMNQHGLEIDDRWVIENGFNEAGGYHAMGKLLTLPEKARPNAVAAVNDPVAFGAMDAIREAGLKVPDDIAIVGFTNDIRAGLVASPLTTVHQPAYEVGKKAASKLIKTIEDRTERVENVQLITKLIIRKSCGS
ncbi:MAG: LacI family transcriptional regulator [Balneolaceae bacterium]|nr:MAG: LacI family transcriptional regulator [Balneolaceae bacterium]